MARQRGAFWREEEEERLLLIMEEMAAGDRVMPSKHFPNISLFNKVAGRFVVVGFTRTETQCQAKFKKLKYAFGEGAWSDGRGFPQKHRPPFFNILHRLWDRAGLEGEATCK